MSIRFQDVRIALALSVMGTPFILGSLHIVGAQVMSSSNYQIQADSINTGGGYSVSGSYIQESTFGEVGTGESASASYQLKAGYQQMTVVFISLSDEGNVTLSPSIGGVSGGTSNGSTTYTIITDSPAGYQFSLVASASPAMVSGTDSIADYIPSGADPDFSFTTGATDSHFGYSPEGTDIVQRYLDNGSDTCNQPAGSDTALSCWDGPSTTAIVIASASAPTHPSGATTSIFFRVGIGSLVNQSPGTYTATTTVTAVAL